MIFIVVKQPVRAKYADEWPALVRDFTDGSRAEPGCLFYTLAEDLAEPGLIRAFEIYADDAALKAQGESEHFKAWRAVGGQYPRQDRTLYDATKRS